MNGPSMRLPSAYLPLAMSFAALATVLYHIAVFGAAHEADEGAAAHTLSAALGCAGSGRGIFRFQVAAAKTCASVAGLGLASRCRARGTCSRFLFQSLVAGAL